MLVQVGQTCCTNMSDKQTNRLFQNLLLRQISVECLSDKLVQNIGPTFHSEFAPKKLYLITNTVGTTSKFEAFLSFEISISVKV